MDNMYVFVFGLIQEKYMSYKAAQWIIVWPNH